MFILFHVDLLLVLRDLLFQVFNLFPTVSSHDDLGHGIWNILDICFLRHLLLQFLVADLALKLLEAMVDLRLLVSAKGKHLLESLSDNPLDIDPLRSCWVVEVALQFEEEVLCPSRQLLGLRAAPIVVKHILLAIGRHGAIEIWLDWTWTCTSHGGAGLADKTIVHDSLADSLTWRMRSTTLEGFAPELVWV